MEDSLPQSAKKKTNKKKPQNAIRHVKPWKSKTSLECESWILKETLFSVAAWIINDVGTLHTNKWEHFTSWPGQIWHWLKSNNQKFYFLSFIFSESLLACFVFIFCHVFWWNSVEPYCLCLFWLLNCCWQQKHFSSSLSPKYRRCDEHRNEQLCWTVYAGGIRLRGKEDKADRRARMNTNEL